MSDFITQQPIILASASKARKDLLEALGLKFDIVPSHCDEDAIKQYAEYQSFNELAGILAANKALLISENYPEHYVIGADQLCVLGNTIFDKPGNHDTAVKQLHQLSGKTHEQISACCIAKEGEIIWSIQESAYLTMQTLTNRTIEAYLLAEQPYQSCGAYHYEGQAKWLFTQVKGSDSTIQGLPIQELIKALIELQIITI